MKQLVVFLINFLYFMSTLPIEIIFYIEILVTICTVELIFCKSMRKMQAVFKKYYFNHYNALDQSQNSIRTPMCPIIKIQQNDHYLSSYLIFHLLMPMLLIFPYILYKQLIDRSPGPLLIKLGLFLSSKDMQS